MDVLTGLTVHPTTPHVAMATFAGTLQIWDHSKKELELSRLFNEPQHITTIAYAKDGSLIGMPAV